MKEESIYKHETVNCYILFLRSDKSPHNELILLEAGLHHMSKSVCNNSRFHFLSVCACKQ